MNTKRIADNPSEDDKERQTSLLCLPLVKDNWPKEVIPFSKPKKLQKIDVAPRKSPPLGHYYWGGLRGKVADGLFITGESYVVLTAAHPSLDAIPVAAVEKSLETVLGVIPASSSVYILEDEDAKPVAAQENRYYVALYEWPDKIVLNAKLYNWLRYTLRAKVAVPSDWKYPDWALVIVDARMQIIGAVARMDYFAELVR